VKSLTDRRPIIGSAAGYGIIARCSELAGVDFIVIYATGRSRAMGIGTALIGDPNQVVLDIAHEILFVVEDTPIMAGLNATDPIRKIDKLLQAYADLGFSGVFGFPTVGSRQEWQRNAMESRGRGIGKEVEVAKMARDEFGLWTIWYVWNLEDVARFAEVCDAIAVHVGWTEGGLTGPRAHLGIEKACERIQQFY
jgi:predicted TIM-barrel enzyme